MDFNYQNNSGINQKINLFIGMHWSESKIQNNTLNTIFSMVDDGDKIISEKEFNIIEKLLNIANRLFNKKPKDNLIENKELDELINKIKNKSIDIQNLKNNELDKINVQEYSIENLKKRYPPDKYTITESCGVIKICDKLTGKQILEVTNEPKKLYVTLNPNSKNQQMYQYDKNGTLNSYTKNGKTINPIADAINKDICAKNGIFPTTGSNIEKHIKQITKDNVMEILEYYKTNYGESLEDAINNEWGLYFGEKNKDLKKRLFSHIENCLDEHFGVSKSFSNKTSQIINKEVNYKGDSYSVSRQNGILTIKNMRTGKISKINENTMFEDLTLEQKSRMRRIFEELPGEVLADLAVECKKINNGLNDNSENTAAFYNSKNDDITIEVNGNIVCADDLVHEIGHAVDNTGKWFYGKFTSSNNAEFKRVFEEEKAKYKAADHNLYEDTKNSVVSNPGNYATRNEHEMFAECYALITTGNCSSKVMLLEYFPKTVNMAKKMLSQIRNLSEDERSRA